MMTQNDWKDLPFMIDWFQCCVYNPPYFETSFFHREQAYLWTVTQGGSIYKSMRSTCKEKISDRQSGSADFRDKSDLFA